MPDRGRKPGQRGSLATPTLLLATLLACGLLAAGCGSDGEEIPQSAASDLTNQLNDLQADIEAGDCAAADERITEINQTVSELDSKVDPEIRKGLRQLTDKLDEVFADGGCEETTTTTTEPTTETTETTETTTSEPTIEPTTTTEETTTSTSTTEEPETPPGQTEPPGGGKPEDPGNGGGISPGRSGGGNQGGGNG